MLKKEFKRKDVDRMRNLIKGNANESSDIQIGYNKKNKNYKEGDIWVENKKTWTIKNGIKQTVSKLTSLRKEVFMPLSCPKCNKIMKKRLDKPNYKIHKMCHDCVIDFEHKLKYTGEYDNYIKKLEAKNSLNLVDEMESYLLNAVNATNNGYVSEKGELERWVGGIDKEKITKEIIEASKIRRDHIKKQLNESK